MIDILPLLDGVRDTGPGRYMARCPAHDDKSPSLSVKVDDKVLLHCFAGCDIEDIVSALGLTFADLMPDAATDQRGRCRRPRPNLSARDALIAMDHNALVVAVIGADLLEHHDIDEPTWTLLAQAVARIGAARDVVCPARHKP